MSVFSKNPFELLGEDGEVAPVAAAKPAAAAPKAAATPATPKEVPGAKPGRGRGAPGSYYRGGPKNVLKSDRSPNEATVVDPESGYDGERRALGKGDRGRYTPKGHGEGRGRGRANRRGAHSGGARGAFASAGDAHKLRKSQDAHTDSEKKVNQGWGADEGSAELAAETEGVADAQKEEATETPAAEGTPAETTEEAKQPEEEEDKTKSYEEYLAEKAAAALNIAKLSLRQVEGTAEMVGQALKKETEEFFSGAKKEEKSNTEKKVKKEKVFIEVEGKFAPPASERRGGRGGAAAGRGGNRSPREGGAGRGRGAPRGGARGGAARSSAPAVAVNDEKAFPALGA